jgi:signal transduction histidine kinase
MRRLDEIERPVAGSFGFNTRANLLPKRMKILEANDDSGCAVGATARLHQPTDEPLQVSEEERAAIRAELDKIRLMLEPLFPGVYGCTPGALRVQRQAADLIEAGLEEIAKQWASAVEQINRVECNEVAVAELDDLELSLRNALCRFIAHLRDPQDIETYVYLRKHCQKGILSRASPAGFNAVHIALKRVILHHIYARAPSRVQRKLIDAVVGAIDERRLMVAHFYIESRERALRASEEKYRRAIDLAPDPILNVHPESGVILGLNSAAERLRKRMIDRDIFGKPIWTLVSPSVASGAMRHLEAVKSRGSDQLYDLPIAGHYFDVNSALICYGEDQFIQMTLRDVTQRREMLDELLKFERLAAAGTFAAGVAHEVNNPLASIFSLVQSLLSSEQDPNRRMTLHTILSQITRISGTLKDLVNFARPSMTQRKTIDLNALVNESLRLISYSKRFQGLRIEAELAPDLKPVFADDKEVQQVLLNLLFNAADAGLNEGGVIRVVTRNEPGEVTAERASRVRLQVIDNGIGIPREHLRRIFDPFFTTKPAGSGMGLGLSVCQRIVLSNRGTIQVDSELGKGTTVTVTLPAYEAGAAEQLSGAQ